MMDTATINGYPKAPPLLRCPSCQRAMVVSTDEIASYAGTGHWPRCCGEVMSLEPKAAPEP